MALNRLQRSLVITGIEVITVAATIATYNATHNVVLALGVLFVGLGIEHYVSLPPDR